jgi:hypothetical protein
MSEMLNKYDGTFSPGSEKHSVVAASMEIAARVLAASQARDPVILQCVQEGIEVEVPAINVTFRTTVMPDTAELAGCVATPSMYVLPAGTTQIFTASPVTGWQFDHWDINGQTGSDEEVALLTIPSSTAIVEIQAVFTT